MVEKTNQQVRLEKKAELTQQRSTYLAKLETALKKAGFAVTQATVGGRAWPDARLHIKVEAHPDFENCIILETMRSAYRYRYNIPTGLRLTYRPSDGWVKRGGRRFTRLDDALVARLVKFVERSLDDHINIRRAETAQNAKVTRWLAVRQQQLSGMLVPPGLDIKILMEEPHAGAYRLNFSNIGSIEETNLTAQQVRKLADLLNELQHSAEGFVIVHSQSNNSQFWNGAFWQNTAKCWSEAEAKAKALIAKKLCPYAEVRPYPSVATI